MKLSKKIACIAVLAGALPVAAMAGDMGTLYTQIGFSGLGIGYAKSVMAVFDCRVVRCLTTAS